MKTFKLNLALITTYICGFGAMPVYSLPNSPASLVEDVATRLEGSMDTAAQAAVNSERVNVRMTTCRVKLAENGNSDAIYLYQEQALNESLDSPYRQRFLEIAPGDSDNVVVSHSYKPDNAEVWSGFCDRPPTERVIASDRLGEPVCSVFLKPLINVYLGKTQPGGCPTNFRGATKITNSIILYEGGMDTWDRGFNDAGERVWGADATGYQYRRLEGDN